MLVCLLQFSFPQVGGSSEQDRGHGGQVRGPQHASGHNLRIMLADLNLTLACADDAFADEWLSLPNLTGIL